MTNNLMLVFSNPVAGEDDQYNAWYDNIHLGDVLKVPGVVGAKRYDLVEMPSLDGEPTPAPPHRYLAVYELDGDPASVMAELIVRVESGAIVIDESFDLTSVALAAWRPR
jgi:hypothetical protein